MKFIHMADMHLDSAFATLAGNERLAQERRLEQRKIMKDIVEYISQNNIPYFFIAGDLYEQEYIKKSTIEYINNLFKQIPNTQIFITPGNHDPYINNSFYKQYKWNSNVHIFSSNLEIIELEGINIYGYGFDNFYMQNKYPKIEIKDKQKINILITHGSIDAGSQDEDGQQYNPMSSKQLKELGFDYVALGHIHKASYKDYENQKIVYPGSTVSIGFDELGERGIIEGEINEKSKEITLKFIPTHAKTFEEIEYDITNTNSQEDLVEQINSLKLSEDKFYKLILTGKRNFEIDEKEIQDLLTNSNIIRIRNKTKIKYDIEDIAKQISLRGLFAKGILEKMQDADEQTQEKLLEAFEIGIDILNK